jgi:site-specific DNA-cytosine methylase
MSAGFKPVGIVENDPACRETLEANGADGRLHTAGWTIHEETVTTFDYSRVGKTALLSAGAR